jgi:hypothetical protein
VWRIRYSDELYKMYKDVPLSVYIHLKKIMWAGHIVRMEQHRIPKKVLGSCFGEEGQWGDHEIDGKIPYRGMQPTCSGFGTGGLQQEIGRSGGRRLGRPWPKMVRSAIEEEEEDLYLLGYRPLT